MKKFATLALAILLTLSLFALASCGGKDENTIVVGASSTPHAEILEVVKEDLAAKGYTLDIKIYDDYILPNTGVEDGALDANYFQHTPYLNSFNADNGTSIVSAGLVHYEPFGIYGNGVTGNDVISTVIHDVKVIDASAEKGVNHLDIVDNGGYDIVPVEAQTVPAQLKNSDAGTIAVINGNYAIGAGLKIADALATEDASGTAAQTYANIVAVKSGNENTDKIKALVEALQSEKVAKYIADNYDGAVVAIR